MKIVVFILVCAHSAFSGLPSQRIIGGQVANAGQFPYSAAIYKSTSDGSYFCGGALVHQQFILTAGQCVDGAVLFTIYLGTNNIKSPAETSVKLATDEYILHPDFNATSLENDIALIKLRMPVELSSYIRVLDLPIHFLPENTNSLHAIGWGQTSDAAELADELHWVTVGAIRHEECQMIYGNQVTEKMACIIGNYNEGACTGDSGSPLIQYLQGRQPLHAGLSSFLSPRGCESADPSGYTKTYQYVGWIRSVLNG